VARALEQHLEKHARTYVWSSNLFEPGTTTIETLFQQLDLSDYAVLVMTPDDFLISKGHQQLAPRDNIVMEIGLFLGRLGRHRTFIIQPRYASIKLPSDLAGVTLVEYDDKRFAQPREESAAVGSAATTIRRRIQDPKQRELDFISAYIRFIAPETQLTDSYSTILTNHYTTICAEVERLTTSGDWRSLIEVKRRLREYFEYSGRYSEGVQFGRRYITALQELGLDDEVLWTKVKHVGYLLILDGQHASGRTEIENVLSEIDREDTTKRELLFYAYRYLSISYLRDAIGGDMSRSERMLDRAEEVIESWTSNSRKRRELEARLSTNRGNVALAKGDTAEALRCYQESLERFKTLDDLEHIGIAHLKIAEVANAGGPISAADLQSHLQSAEAICIRLGWIEGHARVLEQRARHAALLAQRAQGQRERQKFVRDGLAVAKNAYSFFERIRRQEGVARTTELIAQLRSLAAGEPPVPRKR
jgi:tetratricopeptide (TPR) repeat protein